MENSATRWSRWDTGTVIVIAAVIAAHVAFIVNDTRLPQDINMSHELLPVYYHGLDSLSRAAEILGEALFQITGWYNFLIASVFKLIGRSPQAFRAFDVFWLFIIMGNTALIARRLTGSPAAAFGAAALTGACPIITISARQASIHIPEAALILSCFAIFIYDSKLSRVSSIVSIALLGSLVICLRQSGLIWVGTLVPLLMGTKIGTATYFSVKNKWLSLFSSKILIIIIVWQLALFVPLKTLPQYLRDKMVNRQRYLEQVPQMFEQFYELLGICMMILMFVGFVAFVIMQIKKRKIPCPVSMLLLSWLVMAVVLKFIFEVGMENFCLLAPAAAILACWGLASVSRYTMIAPAALFLLVYMPQWFPLPPGDIAERPWSRFLNVCAPHSYEDDILNLGRSLKVGFTWREVNCLLDATFPPDEKIPHTIAVDHDLFTVSGEDFGRLELFLMGRDNIALYHVSEIVKIDNEDEVEALGIIIPAKRELAEDWKERFPGIESHTRSIIEKNDLEIVWRIITKPFEFQWLTRGGKLQEPSLLPGKFIKHEEHKEGTKGTKN